MNNPNYIRELFPKNMKRGGDLLVVRGRGGGRKERRRVQREWGVEREEWRVAGSKYILYIGNCQRVKFKNL